jgi:hypothetical protein
MPGVNLTQAEADMLLSMDKKCPEEGSWPFPGHGGGKLTIPLHASVGSEQFLLDVNRSGIKLTKITYQNRARLVVPLARLDLDGPPHRNPDGEELPCPHLHCYREGFMDKWAFGLPDGWEIGAGGHAHALDLFLGYCHVVKRPNMQFDLLS